MERFQDKKEMLFVSKRLMESCSMAVIHCQACERAFTHACALTHCCITFTTQPLEHMLVLTLVRAQKLVPRLIVVPLSSHEIDGVRKEKERLTAVHHWLNGSNLCTAPDQPCEPTATAQDSSNSMGARRQ